MLTEVEMALVNKYVEEGREVLNRWKAEQMSHEMIKRIAAVIASPSKWHVIKFDVFSEMWCIVLDDKVVRRLGEAFHSLAEEACEEMNNELLARLVVEAMKEPTQDMIVAGDEYLGAGGMWRAMIDQVLKDE